MNSRPVSACSLCYCHVLLQDSDYIISLLKSCRVISRCTSSWLRVDLNNSGSHIRPRLY